MAISGISPSYTSSAYAPLTPRSRDAQAEPGQTGSGQAAIQTDSAGKPVALAANDKAGKKAGQGQDAASSSAADGKKSESQKAGDKTELSPEQLAQLAKLQARDREVRQHEAAHLAASGGLAISGASFSYQKGPDGVNYAIGGEVGIDTSPGRTPEETIARARIIQAAALAPAEPSGPDRAVAAAAQQMELKARSELAQQALQPALQPAGKTAQGDTGALDAAGKADAAAANEKSQEVAGVKSIAGNQAASAADAVAVAAVAKSVARAATNAYGAAATAFATAGQTQVNVYA